MLINNEIIFNLSFNEILFKKVERKFFFSENSYNDYVTKYS